MSTLALEGSERTPGSGGPPLALRYADIGLLIVALPVFVIADLPLAGYLACAAAWLCQHVVLVLSERSATSALARGERRRAMGTIGFATLGRVWIVTAAILAVGLIGDREDGLAAAVLAAVLVTVHLGVTALARTLDPEAGS